MKKVQNKEKARKFEKSLKAKKFRRKWVPEKVFRRMKRWKKMLTSLENRWH